MTKLKTLIAITLSALSIGCLSTAVVKSVKNAEQANAAIPSGLYDDCESATTVSDLWTAVKTAANSGYNQGTSYDGLWTWYWTTDKKSDNTLMDYYSNTTSYSSTGSQCGNYHSEGDCYNREHSIPKSWWNSPTPSGKGYPQTDIVIVIPTDGWVNNKRSNYPLGETNGGTYKSNNSFSKLGASNFTGYTNIGTVFEVNDEYKGDFARIHFYALAKWNEYNFGQTSEGQVMFRNTTSKTSSNNFGLTDYSVALLYKWHKADPVSDWETQRNERVYGLQGNRNPFVDHPLYADYLWGGVDIPSGGGSSSSSESSSSSSSGSSSETTTTTSGDSGSTLSDVLYAKGFGGYTNNSYSSSGTDYTAVANSTNSTGVKYALQVFNGSTGVVRGNQSTATSNFSARNTTTMSDYYISEVSLTVSTGTIDGSTSGRSVVYFGTSAYTTSPSGTYTSASPASSGQTTLKWTNTDTTKNFFILYNLKTSGNATSESASTSLTIKWAPSSSSTSIGVTGLSLNPTALSLTAGGSKGTITPTIAPSNATNQSITWTSSDTSVATVSDGEVTPLAAGSATITATSVDNSSVYATCAVTVEASSGGETTLSSPLTIAYGDTFSPALPTASASVNSSNTTHTDSTNGITFGEQGIYKGSSNNYIMFAQDKGFLYNTVDLGTISSVAVTYSSGTSTTGKTGVYFGSSVQSTYTTTSNATIAGVSKTDTWTNSTSGYGYFQLSTSNKNVQITQIVVTFSSSSSGGSDTPTVTSVSVSPSTLALDLNGTTSGSLSATVSGTNSPAQTVTWSSDDTDVASVNSSGSVTAVGVGSATITATSTVDATKTGTCTVTVSDTSSSSSGEYGNNLTFKKITSTSEITSGGTYAFVYEGGNVAFNGSLNTLDAASNTITATVLNSKFDTTTGAFFTITGSGSSYKIKSSSGYYIGNASNSNSLSTSTSTEYTNTISFDSSCNVNVVSSGGAYLRYNSDSNQVRFRYYKSSSYSNQKAIQLYRLEIEIFAEDFYDNLTCDATGKTAPTFENGNSWSDYSTTYSSLNTYSKNIFKAADANSSGNIVEKAAERYDYIVHKYGTSTYTNFASRSVSPYIYSDTLFGASNDDSTVAILVIVGLLSATGVGILLFVRKRKEI